MTNLEWGGAGSVTWGASEILQWAAADDASLGLLWGAQGLDWGTEPLFWGAVSAIDSEVGAFVLTGQSLGLPIRFTADAGVFTLPAVSTGIMPGNFVADTGAFALTGQDVTSADNISLEVGAFALTGQSAGALPGAFVAETGFFELAGQEIGGTTATLTADAGSLSVTGQDIEAVRTFPQGPNWVANGKATGKRAPKSRPQNAIPKIPPLAASHDDLDFWKDVEAKRRATAETLKQRDAETARKNEIARKAAAEAKALADAEREKEELRKAQMAAVRNMMKQSQEQETQLLLNALWGLRDSGGLSPKSELLIERIIDIVAP